MLFSLLRNRQSLMRLVSLKNVNHSAVCQTHFVNYDRINKTNFYGIEGQVNRQRCCGLHTTTGRHNKNRKPMEFFHGPRALKDIGDYCAIRFKLFLLVSYFDKTFKEDDFLDGAKQAVSYVSTKISEGKVNDLDDVLTSEGIQSSRDLLQEFYRNPDILKVDVHEIINLYVNDVGLVYTESGEKHAKILVKINCTTSHLKRMNYGNLEVTIMPTRLLTYSFHRDCTPGCDDKNWYIDRLKHFNMPGF